MIRRTIDLGQRGTPDWRALRGEETFLYRAIADQDRAVLGVGLYRSCEAPAFAGNGVVQDWTFGHRCYDPGPDVKRRIPPTLGILPMEHWWVPRWVFEWRSGSVRVHALEGDERDAKEFARMLFSDPSVPETLPHNPWKAVTDREVYLGKASNLLSHIQRGDIYEINYCTERRAHLPGFDPFGSFALIHEHTQAPFAAFHRSGRHFALCASPERFLAFDHTQLIGQPMKGTRPRSMDGVEDRRLAEELRSDAKERSENIMALDVMRNDLSRVAASRSVHVDELCVVRSYPAVHQMISTVSAVLRDGLDPMDAVRSAFPMASMTGAPKIRAMQLIDEMEEKHRGLFSGTLGFFAPDGTGDLNVVIRTVLYDAESQWASLTTGSALTATCDPEREWEECELKARSIMNALEHA